MGTLATQAVDALANVELESTQARLTTAGRALAIVAIAGFLPSLVIGGAVATVPAAAGALLLVAAAASWRNLRGASVAVRGFLRETATARVVLETAVCAGGATLRDVIVLHERIDHASPRGLVAQLPAGGICVLACPHRMQPRGHIRVHRATLRSTYPFGLIERRQHYRQVVDHLSRPRLGRLGPGAAQLLAALAPGAEAGGARRGWDEFHGLRPWREGEGTRLVHWRLSARTGRRVVRELVGDALPPVHLYLWPGVRSRRTVRLHRTFEEAVSLTATLARSLLRGGLRVRLTVLDVDVDGDLSIDGRRGPMAFESMLDALARVQPRQERELGQVRHLASDPRRRERRVLICSGDRPDGEFDAVLDAEARDVDLWFESPHDTIAAAART
ncbi:DUF58 domain-containing protein [Engelhardtia mirabilis]|uniref:DUF58 domain-containing protein n=1 Tax=Engelhardtia mirabilis TaxID=2528011 RepID=A0A518BEY0_9BACT|nr:hypothetical protein Pla133_06040 [Planctomycetes bacterium Pla133]QDU99865.1 hypothetical protein Pla86_06040 [Planctomycetes bacterium Pla86]